MSRILPSTEIVLGSFIIGSSPSSICGRRVVFRGIIIHWEKSWSIWPTSHNKSEIPRHCRPNMPRTKILFGLSNTSSMLSLFVASLDSLQSSHPSVSEAPPLHGRSALPEPRQASTILPTLVNSRRDHQIFCHFLWRRNFLLEYRKT